MAPRTLRSLHGRQKRPLVILLVLIEKKVDIITWAVESAHPQKVTVHFLLGGMTHWPTSPTKQASAAVKELTFCGRMTYKYVQEC